MILHLRRRADETNSKTTASAPPAGGQNSLWNWILALVGAVVFTVKTTVCPLALFIVSEAGMLHVGGLPTAVGVMAQLKLTVPVNPPDGVNVTVDVSLLIEPGATFTDVPLIANPGRIPPMLYTPVDIELGVVLPATATALIVVVCVTEMGPVYNVGFTEGGAHRAPGCVPSVV